jgi:hypothetical protein
MRFSLSSRAGRRFPSIYAKGRCLSSAVLVIAAMGCSLATSAARAADPGQEVWLVSTRSAPHCGDLQTGVEQLAFWRLDSQDTCRWLTADAAAFQHTGAPQTPTTIYIHGARTSFSAAVEQGFCLFARMQQYAAGRPFRLVVWAWPADRMARLPRADMQGEAAEADADAYYLARVLAEVKPGTPLCLIGYSFGTRIASGALQLLANGPAAGHQLPAESLSRWASGPRPVRAMFLASAMDADWLMPGCCEGMALSQLQRLLITQNCADRTLRRYPRLYGLGGPEAMGHSGPICCLPPGSGCEKVEVVDVTCEVGKRHDWRLYQAALSFVVRLAWYTFLTDGRE